MLTQNKRDLTGEHIGSYELEELLKVRVASDFYLARDVKLDQPVFVEVLRVTAEQDPDVASRFQRRTEALAQIKHPNIAPLIDAGTTGDGYGYTVIEYVAGKWLADALAEWRDRGDLPAVDEALRLVRQIADALSIAHPAGLIHHDLRPDNILLRDGDGSPVLVDLSLPIALKARDPIFSETRSNMLDYASPEEIEGKGIGRRSNVYSLGILLYELLTGHRPLLPTSSWDIFERSTMPKEVPLEEVRAGLAGETYRLVRNCLWRQEWSRFESADELISAIDTAILAEQALPKPTIWSSRRRRWLYIAVPALALLVLVFGLLLVWGQFVNAEPGQPTVTPERVAGGSGQSSGNDGSAVPAATITLTRAAPPTSAAAANVPVFGPAADQVFAAEETIDFAWIWLSLPTADQHFAIYVLAEDEESEPILAGTVQEPDNASLYLLKTSAAELGLSAGAYLWQVRLESRSGGGMVSESDPRRFFVQEEPTATPTQAPPAELPSATPTAVTGTPTATQTPATPVCVPQRPPGWIEHAVAAGESPSIYSEQADVPVAEIFAANCITADTVLSVGQVLFIPPPLPTLRPPATNTPVPRPPLATQPPSTGGGSGGGSGGGGSGGGGGGDPEPEPTEEPVRPTSTPAPPPPGD